MKTLKILSAFLLLGIFGLSSCKKDDPKPAILSTITTDAATAITKTGATLGGDITSDGGGAVTERGICYSLTADPTIADTKVASGTGKGAFTANLTDLTANTTYHARAYSTNSVGTAYGNDITFTTSPVDVYIAGLRYDAGKPYKVVAYWKNGVSTDLTDGSFKIDNVLQVVVSGQDVYVLGSTNPNGNSIIKLWKNGVMSDITNGTTDCKPNAMAISGSDVYVVGIEFEGLVGYVAKYWKNGVATALGTNYSFATSIAISGNDIYAAGYEYNAANESVAKYWKNGVTTSLTDGSKSDYAESIAVSGNDVYLAGEELNNNNIWVAKYWKNGVATTLTDGTSPAYTSSIAISGNDAYVVGYTFNNGGKAYIWKNGVSTPLVDGTNNTYAYQIAISGEDIYVAGGNESSSILWKNGIKLAPFDGTDSNIYAAALFVADK